ncbi:MAG: gamma-glutamyl-gamma-aminobutyrate hydrolase family protein [Lactobacillales bacterium]|jgi:putative glutamine amidotransferase|nr:gamma-glutamyl-gamma-aminobutyrate hydrolase family protein [Lactobacillales bacterium]
MQTVIGIAGNEVIEGLEHFHGNFVSYTQKNFATAMHELGALPMILPISDPSFAAGYVNKIDKLLLAGGHDVSPLNFGEEPHYLLQETNPDRDAFELALVAEAVKQKKPIFGICRGMQILNVAYGGTLYQDLSLYENYKVKHLQAPTKEIFTTHTVRIEKESTLGNFLPEIYQVNSYHHQAIKVLGSGLRPIAESPDGLIEAVESENAGQRVLGVQWHPEMLFERIATELDLFRYFVEEL